MTRRSRYRSFPCLVRRQTQPWRPEPTTPVGLRQRACSTDSPTAGRPGDGYSDVQIPSLAAGLESKVRGHLRKIAPSAHGGQQQFNVPWDGPRGRFWSFARHTLASLVAGAGDLHRGDWRAASPICSDSHNGYRELLFPVLCTAAWALAQAVNRPYLPARIALFVNSGSYAAKDDWTAFWRRFCIRSPGRGAESRS